MLKKNIKINIVNYVERSGSDYTQCLYLDNKLETYGDEYHDDIGAYIRGFLSGLVKADLELEISTEERVNKRYWLNPPKMYRKLKNEIQTSS